MNKNRREIIRALSLITQMGVTMLVTIFMCIFIGMAIDKLFGTKLLVWFIVLGAISGFRSVYLLIRGYLSYGEDKNNHNSL